MLNKAIEMGRIVLSRVQNKFFSLSSSFFPIFLSFLVLIDLDLDLDLYIGRKSH